MTDDSHWVLVARFGAAYQAELPESLLKTAEVEQEAREILDLEEPA